MCASLSYTCMPWYSPGIWYYNRLILLLLKLGIVVIMILVIRWLIVILLYYFLVPFYSYYFLIQYIFMVYYGMLTWYIHVHLFFFNILIGSFNFLNLHIQIYVYCIYWAGIWEDHVHLRSTESVLPDYRNIWYSSCLPFHSVDFLWFSITWTPYLFYGFIIE